MRSDRLKKALESTELLSTELRKHRSVIALNDFIDERINGTQQAIQPLTNDVQLKSLVQVHDKAVSKQYGEIKTSFEDDVIKTQEMCYVPFPFVQSETLTFKDGKRIVTTFFPNLNRVTAKQIVYSADKTTVETTTYNKNGVKKCSTISLTKPDGSKIEEKIDYLLSCKEVKTYNKYNVVTQISSYINDVLSFEMTLDDSGQIITEKTFYTSTSESVLKKEILYSSDNSYTVKEYTFDGNIISDNKVIVKN